MNHIALLKGGANGAVQTVLKEQVTLPFDDMGEQIAEIGRIFIEQVIEVQLCLCGHEIVETHL